MISKHLLYRLLNEQKRVIANPMKRLQGWKELAGFLAQEGVIAGSDLRVTLRVTSSEK
jgi:hypothetical protein